VLPVPVVGAVTAILQVLAFGGVVGQLDRAVIGGHGLLASPELVEQVRPRRPGLLEAAGALTGVPRNGIEGDEPGRGAVDLGGDGCERDTADDRTAPSSSPGR
jgi:hypothetical protein